MGWFIRREILLLVGFSTGYTLIASLILHKNEIPSYLADFKEGELWRFHDLYAPFEFGIYRATQAPDAYSPNASEATSLAFRLDTTIAPAVQKTLDKVLSSHSSRLRAAFADLAQYAYRYGYTDIPLTNRQGIAILLKGKEETNIALEALVDSARLRQWIKAHFSAPLQDSLEKLLQYLPPNCRYDSQATQQRVPSLQRSLSPFQGIVQRGERIIQKGEIISSLAYQKLYSLRKAYLANQPVGNRLLRFFGLSLLIFVSTLIAFWYLYATKRLSPKHLRPTFLLITMYLLTLWVVSFIANRQEIWLPRSDIPLYHLAPFALGPIVLAIFFDDRVGFISAIALGAQLSLIMEDPVEYFFVHGFSSMLVVFQLRVVYRRAHIYYALGLLLLSYIGTYLGYHLFRQASFQGLLHAGWGLAMLGGNVLVSLLVYPLIYLIERLFRISSDITFLELLDIDHPLLRELKQRAPGTFQHSLSVAALAEAAARRIGAHSLKVHVMALFHDIGKLEHPEYFIENLAAISQGHAANPHHNLTPLESARAIRRHVEYGVELGVRYRLPMEVIQGICTHHGTTYIHFFWEKQKRERPQEAPALEAEFRYEGPKPRTREETILMLADSLEASTRALPDLTPEKLRRHIQRIIQQRIAEGQLEDSALSFEQIKELEETFYQQLLSLHHARIQYPESPSEPTPVAKGAAVARSPF
ncbi:MAG: HDIG domain-containing protein [Bacteroidia bacterium]|nr:HDIG domain-containing protein [Bacteroidia bacterium]MDW8088576.1 HDIG domain-containing protein [Bacteroidia bacterium]